MGSSSQVYILFIINNSLSIFFYFFFNLLSLQKFKQIESTQELCLECSITIMEKCLNSHKLCCNFLAVHFLKGSEIQEFGTSDVSTG